MLIYFIIYYWLSVHVLVVYTFLYKKWLSLVPLFRSLTVKTPAFSPLCYQLCLNWQHLMLCSVCREQRGERWKGSFYSTPSLEVGQSWRVDNNDWLPQLYNSRKFNLSQEIKYIIQVDDKVSKSPRPGRFYEFWNCKQNFSAKVE